MPPATDTPTMPGLTGGRNSLFPFIAGHQLPVRSSLTALQYNPQAVSLINSLASFSGQDPDTFWGSFFGSLPRGGAVPLTSVR
jgi:hypothetical protein